MAFTYTIYRTDGTIVSKPEDGTLDTANVSLGLIGKNYAGYGNVQNHNFVQLLENFSNSTPPVLPMVGQLWWDASNKLINICTVGGGSPTWKVLSQSLSQTTEPTTPEIGDVWFDTSTDQYKVYTGTTWIIVGPEYTKAQDVSGVMPRTVWDDTSSSHVILQVMSGNVVYAVFSKDSTFTLGNTSIPGFGELQPGLTLSNSSGVSNIKINGYATLDSPIFTGVPIAPTASQSTANTQIATTAFVNTGFVNIINGAPVTLDTLGELAAAILNDPGFGSNVYANISRIDNTVTTIISNTNSRFTAVNVAISSISLTPGPSGYSGYSGFSGFSGYSGYSGFSGPSGYSGWSGISVSGFSGWSGWSGATGAAGQGVNWNYTVSPNPPSGGSNGDFWYQIG